MQSALLAASALALTPAIPQSVPPAVRVQASPEAAVSSTMPAAPAGPVRVSTPAPVTLPARVRPRPPSRAELRVRAANRAAIREPAATSFVNAVQVYPYSAGTLYRLFAAPERITDIALQAGETVVAVAAGDTARWTVGDTTSGAGDSRRVHILVKPFAPGLSTNLVITTDRRAYHLQLESTPSTAMAALSWNYPQDELLAIRRREAAAEAAKPVAERLGVETLNFAYRITGDEPAWRPLRAFDDGRQTFIQFPASLAVSEAPPLFVIGERGEAQLVNYRVSGRYYVIDRLFDAAELRLGSGKQSVVRISRASEDQPRRRNRRAS